MRADAGDKWLLFEQTRDVKRLLADRFLLPTRIEIQRQPPWSFDAEHADTVEAGRRNLLSQFFRPMEVRRDEVARITGVVSIPTARQGSLANRDDVPVQRGMKHQAVHGTGIPSW